MDNYADFLAGLGYLVDKYSMKADALIGLRQRPPELLLLDISIHGEREAGFDICGQIRRETPLLPIIFLSAYYSDADRISGLRLGADDYITKDESLEYLAARVEALFRRRSAYLSSSGSVIQTGSQSMDATQNVQFDLDRSTATWKARRVELTLTQFWLLHELCRIAGKTKTTDELMRAAKLTVEPNTIAVHIKAIRRAFESIDAGFDQIRSVRGHGYRWIPL